MFLVRPILMGPTVNAHRMHVYKKPTVVHSEQNSSFSMPATCLHNGVLCCSSLDGTPYLCMSVKPSEIRLQVSDVIHDTIASVCLLSQTSTNHAQYTKKYKFMIQTGQIIVCYISCTVQ